jgi:DNA-binding YbaB/EbfC family protein
MLPGMPDFSQILLPAQQMQAEMERAQASLSEQEVTGTSGGGLVTAVLNGGGDLLRLTIDPSVVDPADVETLEDLIVAAVHDARRAAQDIANDTMGAAASGLTGSLDLSALGLSLPNFGPADEEDEYLDDEDDEDDEEGEEGDGEDGVAEIEVITVEVVEGQADDPRTPPAAPPLGGSSGA